MTNRKICFNQTLNAPKSKGFAKEQPLKNYLELTESEELAKLVTAIRFTSDHDERRKLKSNLPFRCPHYFRFKDDHRNQASIIPEAFTWQTCIDIDDESQVEEARVKAFLLNKERCSTWITQPPASCTSTSEFQSE